MLEDWFKKGAVSRQPVGTLTPEPEFRALYLVLLGRLEDEGRQATGLGGSEGGGGNVQMKEAETKEEKERAEKELGQRIEEWKWERGIR